MIIITKEDNMSKLTNTKSEEMLTGISKKGVMVTRGQVRTQSYNNGHISRMPHLEMCL
jgi:hypothetical protein